MKDSQSQITNIRDMSKVKKTDACNGSSAKYEADDDVRLHKHLGRMVENVKIANASGCGSHTIAVLSVLAKDYVGTQPLTCPLPKHVDQETERKNLRFVADAMWSILEAASWRPSLGYTWSSAEGGGCYAMTISITIIVGVKVQ